MDIGIQISSVKRYLATGDDVAASFDKMAAIGFRYAQMQWIDPAVDDARVADELARTGLVSIGTQDYCHVVFENFARVVRQNKLWGSNHICISGVPPQYADAGDINGFVAAVNEHIRIAEQDGMFMSFHPRRQELIADADGKTVTDILLENTPDSFQLLADFYHILKAKIDPVAVLERYGHRVTIAHCKDGTMREDGKEILMPAGQGDTDWKPIIEACKRYGVLYALVEQESWQKDAFECLKEGYEYLKGL